MSWTLITGGAKRLGATLALALAEKGESLVIHYRESREEALALAKKCEGYGVEARILQGDFSSAEGVERFIADYLHNFSNTKTLINNVGNYFIAPLLETPVEEWYSLFQLNLNTPFMLSKALSSSIISNRGSIINLGVAGVQRRGANPYSAAYTLSKEALYGMTRLFAVELAAKNVRVNMISPGMLDISVDLAENEENLPMRRSVGSLEVAQVLLFLLDPTNPSITGQNIEIAGGYCLK